MRKTILLCVLLLLCVPAFIAQRRPQTDPEIQKMVRDSEANATGSV